MSVMFVSNVWFWAKFRERLELSDVRRRPALILTFFVALCFELICTQKMQCNYGNMSALFTIKLGIEASSFY